MARIVAQRVGGGSRGLDPVGSGDAGPWPVTPRTGLRVSVATSAGGDAYPVTIGHRVLGELPDLLPATGSVPHRALVVHQPGLEGTVERVTAALEAMGTQVRAHRIEAAEAGKSLAGIEGIWEACAAAGLDRRDLLVAVGGGAATDVTGFAAATWMRGVDVVHVPTTLLAMVDASVGGKTGINTAAGKNLVGAFHQPRAVVADLDLLDGLPAVDVRAGLAEVIKCGYIDAAEVDGWEILSRVREGARLGDDPRAWPFLAELVQLALAVKARAVAADTREAGVREHLNFGHTLAHALEKVEGYRLRHGDAVAIGMVYAAALGQELGLEGVTADEVAELLARTGLPTRYDGNAGWAEVRAAMAGDKKARAGTLRFVLLDEVCEPVTREVTDEAALERAWGRVAG
ncbi:3-dehydroquinate synthase [Kytococcus sedentarius]|uniref:3-dehydroquinate synthase n=1 Tax=Kytococcus sedentarius TaxID=1276 RepID=UPI0035BC5D65